VLGFLGVPLVVLKKQSSKILNDDIYTTDVTSFTKGITYPLTLSKKYINSNDSVLIIDDFLANGEAASGAIRLINMANANIAGIGIVIEKTFQPGRTKLEELGFEVYSLARIAKLKKDYIEFVD
jgi:xanthine phosphoribosyltransferase